jgi:hypothetical protein
MLIFSRRDAEQMFLCFDPLPYRVIPTNNIARSFEIDSGTLGLHVRSARALDKVQLVERLET